MMVALLVDLMAVTLVESKVVLSVAQSADRMAAKWVDMKVGQ